MTINYGYREFPAGTSETAPLTKILDEAWAEDVRYFTNQDTDIHPRTEQWSNGANQADELNRLMQVRRSALGRIGEHTIRNGAAMTTIEEPLVPIFMYHRYAVEGAASMVAGQDFVYAMRGDGRTPTKWESAVNQRKALEALASTLKPSELTIPTKLLGLIPPRPPGFGIHRELFPRNTGEGVRSQSIPAPSPPTSPSASCCSPIAPPAWWRSTPSIPRSPGSKRSSTGWPRRSSTPPPPRPTRPKCAAPKNECWSIGCRGSRPRPRAARCGRSRRSSCSVCPRG